MPWSEHQPAGKSKRWRLALSVLGATMLFLGIVGACVTGQALADTPSLAGIAVTATVSLAQPNGNTTDTNCGGTLFTVGEADQPGVAIQRWNGGTSSLGNVAPAPYGAADAMFSGGNVIGMDLILDVSSPAGQAYRIWIQIDSPDSCSNMSPGTTYHGSASMYPLPLAPGNSATATGCASGQYSGSASSSFTLSLSISSSCSAPAPPQTTTAPTPVPKPTAPTPTAPAAKPKTMKLSLHGTVGCASHSVEGIWVSVGTTGVWAKWSAAKSNQATYSASLTAPTPSSVTLDVGCGGSTKTWWSSNMTPGKSFSSGGSVELDAHCSEAAGTKKVRCAWGKPSDGPTAAEQAAVKWATNLLGSSLDSPGHKYWYGCLAFAFNAYEDGASLEIRKDVNYSINADTYPSDIWGKFTHGTTGTGTPPYGALVFWNSTGGRTDSHVAISIGGGEVISTNVDQKTVTGYKTIHEESMSQFANNSWNVYKGWWLPDG